MNIRKAVIVVLVLVFANALKAQQVPLFNQYFTSPFLAYPSAIAFAENPNLSLIYRGQWSGLEGAPKGLGISYANPLTGKIGYGINVTHYEVGLVQQTKIGAGFSYSLLKGQDHSLSAGGFLGYSLFSINEANVSPESFNDQVLQNLLGNNGSALSLDLSLSYRYKALSVNFAVPNVVNNSISDDAYVQINEDNIPDYLAAFAYRFTLDPVNEIYVTPQFSWRFREVIGSEFDVLAQVEYKDKFLFSGGYRGNYGATVGAGFKINPTILFTYHYDFGKSDIPFLSDGFNEIGLNFNFKKKADRLQGKYTEAASILELIRREKIYDRNLIEEKDQQLVEDYLYSLETEGSKREKRAAAKKRFQDILDEIKDEEFQRLEAEALEKQRQEAAAKASEEAERERIASQARAQAERERIAREDAARVKAAEEAAKAAEPEEGREARATAAALAKLSPEERARVEQINELVEPEDLRELIDPENPNELATVDFEFVIVIASYRIDSKWSRVYLNSIQDVYPDAKIFASRKRGLDYVYVGGYNDYNTALERMNNLRDTTEYKDAWVHIIRLSR